MQRTIESNWKKRKKRRILQGVTQVSVQSTIAATYNLMIIYHTAFCKEFTELVGSLAPFKKLADKTSNLKELTGFIQETITNAIEDAITAGENVESLKEQMALLCYRTFDIGKDLREWAIQEVNNVHEKLTTVDRTASCLLPTHVVVPALFTKDTLYHASVCCQIVSTCTPANVKEALNSLNNTFDEASLSLSYNRENVDRYLIARQGNKVYMAFQSEPTLSGWIGSYTSFEQGAYNNTLNKYTCLSSRATVTSGHP